MQRGRHLQRGAGARGAHQQLRPEGRAAETRARARRPLLLPRGGTQQLVLRAQDRARQRGGERDVRGRGAAAGAVQHAAGQHAGRLREHHHRGPVPGGGAEGGAQPGDGELGQPGERADHAGEARHGARGAGRALGHAQDAAGPLPPAAPLRAGRAGAEQPVRGVGRAAAERAGPAAGAAGRGGARDAAAGRAPQPHPVRHLQRGAARPGPAAAVREQRHQPDGRQSVQRGDQGPGPAGVPPGESLHHNVSSICCELVTMFY